MLFIISGLLYKISGIVFMIRLLKFIIFIREEAYLKISKVQLERQLQEQQLQRKVDVEKAMAEAEVARIQSQSLTPAYIRYRELQILEKLAESDNKVFVPSAMLDSVAGQVQLGRQ